MEEDTIVTDEKCSICEELLKDGEGRFRTPDRSYCTITDRERHMPNCEICGRAITDEDHKRFAARPEFLLPNRDLCSRASCRRSLDKRILGSLKKTCIIDDSGKLRERPGTGQPRRKMDMQGRIIVSVYDSVEKNDLSAFQDNIQSLRGHFGKHKYVHKEIRGILKRLARKIETIIFLKELNRMPEFRMIAPPPVKPLKAIHQEISILKDPEPGVPKIGPGCNLSRRDAVRAKISNTVKSYFLQVSKELTGRPVSIQKVSLPDDYIYCNWFK